jgi:DNA-binding transcriptional MerR regulator
VQETHIPTREVAALLGCSQQAVRNYWRAGLITGEMRRRGRMGKQQQLWLERASVEQFAAKEGHDEQAG